MKIHNKLAKALLRKKDFIREIETSKSLRAGSAPKNKKIQIEYVYTNNELEFILNKGLRDITSRDIMSDPFLFLMVTEESLSAWLDLHKVDRDIYIEEYRQVEIVSDIIRAIDVYFDNDFVIMFEDLESYGELSAIDKIILRKLYLRSLFVEDKQEKTFTIKEKSKLKRYTKISIAKELYRLLCDEETKDEASKYIEEIKAFNSKEKIFAEHNFVVWLMNFVETLWKQNVDFNGDGLALKDDLPF